MKNTGGSNLTGVGISINGAAAADYTITAAPAIEVAAGDSTTFTIRAVGGAVERVAGRVVVNILLDKEIQWTQRE